MLRAAWCAFRHATEQYRLLPGFNGPPQWAHASTSAGGAGSGAGTSSATRDASGAGTLADVELLVSQCDQCGGVRAGEHGSRAGALGLPAALGGGAASGWRTLAVGFLPADVVALLAHQNGPRILLAMSSMCSGVWRS